MRVEMDSFFWAPAHCEALREYVTKGLSFAEAALEINRKFGTDYTRNAAIGRAPAHGTCRFCAIPTRTKASTRQGRAPAALAAAGEKAKASGISRTPQGQAALRRDYAAAPGSGRPRTGRLPLPLRRRQGRRAHHLLRPSAASGLELLRAAFSPEARRRHRIRTRCRARGAALVAAA
jgi:GcrA cell cycle regulator